MLGSGGGELGGGNSLVAREGRAAVRSKRADLFCGFVLGIPRFCIVVVTVPFVCCSVKLPLSPPTSFCLFLPILPSGGRGGRVAFLLPAAAETRTIDSTLTDNHFRNYSYKLIFKYACQFITSFSGCRKFFLFITYSCCCQIRYWNHLIVI